MKCKFLLLFMSSLNFFSQVGINTQDPKAYLHIEPSSIDNPTGNDGILVPRINKFPSENPTRLGQLVFLHNNDTLDNGFYYWDSAKWISFPGSVEKEIDETIYSFNGQGYTGTTLTRNIRFSQFFKLNQDGFTLNNNEINVGKAGLYLISFTGNSKRPYGDGSLQQSNFNYEIFLNNIKISSVAESLAAEPNASTSATLSFLQRLESGDKLKATITKSNQGSSNYNSYGINNLTLYFIQD